MCDHLGAVSLECVEDRIAFNDRAAARCDAQIDCFNIAERFQTVDELVG